ncbi:MAG: 3'-5' exonuclease [Bacteriovorax sp.]|nr:3'-5' exonuclease [Bacteriovorax sp.]
MKNKFSIVDLKTTGSNREGQKIIEIAIINYDERKKCVEETFSTLINPEKCINHQITLLTGITNLKAMEAPYFYKVAKKIVEMTNGRTIVAHNAVFDYRFLQREFMDLGYNYEREIFCIYKTAKDLFPNLPSYSLEDLCNYFKIKQKRAHRALSDTENCLELLKIISAKKMEVISLNKRDRVHPF